MKEVRLTEREKEKDMKLSELEHRCHRHPLRLFNEDKNEAILCNGCQQPISVLTFARKSQHKNTSSNAGSVILIVPDCPFAVKFVDLKSNYSVLQYMMSTIMKAMSTCSL
ncbi:hypothetical protein CsSME_00028747 [Camellia sinensis var. sinensis]